MVIYGVCSYNAQGALTGRADQEALRARRAARSVIFAAGSGEWSRPHFLRRIEDYNPGVLVCM